MRSHFPAAAALAVLAAASPAQGAAGDFTCSNQAAQVSCSATGCEVETESFTPMSVSRSGDRLEVCAYSGCWSGKLDLIRTRGDLSILHARLSGGHEPAAVAYDRKAKIATLLWGAFALPLNCGEGE